ncbi:MAG: glutamate-ammonia-ligase adenylyltransferase [Kiritimatiellia bacterium]|jgi:glutamate-ammonia-ligase adenylyltransferase
MKPTLHELQNLCPEIPSALTEEHLTRLDDNYFDFFQPAQVQSHLRALASLSSAKPSSVIFEPAAGRRMACTVMAYDYPALFSLITGLLAASGFNILTGEIFTYARRQAGGRRMIIDYFVGEIDASADVTTWPTVFEKNITDTIALLENGKAEDARRRVNEMVADRLSDIPHAELPALYPVTLNLRPAEDYTRLQVIAQDTPAFLFAMSSALALQGISIERVRIRTEAGWIIDDIDLVGRDGQPPTDPERLDQIKFTALLTKQFTYFLGHAPDPYTALCRFGQMAESITRTPASGAWADLLAQPDALRELARLLGASDFIWEDFIRLQYESLLPILQPHVARRRFAHTPDTLRRALQEKLHGADGDDAFQRLNDFKDREIFLIDLDHILKPDSDVRSFAESLTLLAETVIQAAADLIYRLLVERHGRPSTVAGLETVWAICGLGKFGGVAMGYASDIELLLIYNDNGRTDGPTPISNAEFFNTFVRMLVEKVRAKREGIFHIDLQLRPYGNSGPPAVSLESFCRYYAPNGPAQAYEQLALVRLRYVAGDPALGARIERLRDEFIYSGRQLDVESLRQLREKQWAIKVEPVETTAPINRAGINRLARSDNAKFSPGALVDLEYDVQILQIMHAQNFPKLRTPRIHAALEALAELGVLTAEESQELTGAYYFLRRLINGLRMLRGSARDLCLPPEGALEFTHLARRMGYKKTPEMTPEQQLRVDFATQTATVRAFVERHFGRAALPGPPGGNLADLVLSDALSNGVSRKILQTAGFQDPSRALTNLRRLAGDAARRTAFARLAILAGDSLQHSADPDMALNNWERFTQSLPDAASHYALLLSQPRRLEILLNIFAASQFLADTLIRNPDFFDWVTAPDIFNARRPMSAIEADLRSFPSAGDWRDAVRQFRRREILRTGARDICLHAPLPEVTADITALAETIIRLALERFYNERVGAGSGFCVLAFGKLGGRELNYSSDIDLLGICADADRHQQEIGSQALRRIAADLAGHTAEGYAYRVDFRLRPYGSAGQLVCPLSTLLKYYRREAALWEVQALLKARPVAGDLALGRAFLDGASEILRQPRNPTQIADSIRHMRALACENNSATGGCPQNDLKHGPGGIRDLEFMVQGLQLIHSNRQPELLNGNTLESLTLLAGANILTAANTESLKSDYTFLRRVEHCLQLFEDRQVYTIPTDSSALTALARRVIGSDCSADAFTAKLEQCRQRVQRAAGMLALATEYRD